MITLLPVPGGFITLANRCLSPGAVSFLTFGSDCKGFVCGWSYWFGRAISIALQLTIVQNIMATWVTEEKYRYVWISCFFFILFLFNLLNVRRYGEIEYWMTVIKVITIVAIIILGFLLPMGVSSDTRQLGTTSNNTVEYCLVVSDTNGCLPLPGFDCKALLGRVHSRLESRSRVSGILFHRGFRQSCGFLGGLLSSYILLLGR